MIEKRLKKEEDATYIVCVYRHQSHLPETKETRCCKCGTGLWCSPWNLHLPPICFECVLKIPGKKQVMAKRRDWKRAMEVIEQLRKVKR